MKHFEKTFLVILALFTLNCWKKQHHEISAPETPVYTLSGFFVDKDTGDTMKDVIVKLVAVQLLYDYDFTEASDTSKADGSFLFEKITPGMYSIQAFRDMFPVIDQNLVMQHEDKYVEIALPKYILARQTFAPPDYPWFSGICWKTPSEMAGSGYAGDKYSARRAILVGNYENGFREVGQARYTKNNPRFSFYALAYLGTFWTTDGNSAILSINSSKGNVSGTVTTSFTIRDLTSDQNNLWATTSLGKIVKFGNHPSIVEHVYDISAQQPYGIAWSGSNMWIYDLEQNLLQKLDANFHVIKSFRPFAWDDENKRYFMLDGIKYLAFDFSGHLWANDAESVYKFD